MTCRASGLGRPIQHRRVDETVQVTRQTRHGVRIVSGCSPSPWPSRLPSTASAAAPSTGLVRRLPRYYACARLLSIVHSRLTPIRASRRGPQPLSRLRATLRSPRFRRVPFGRDGVLDHGRASAPRLAAPHMLPSTIATVSASAGSLMSRLNSPPRPIAVYASPGPSPAKTQHSLLGGPLRPYPGGTSTRWNAPASPGASEIQPYAWRATGLRAGRATGDRRQFERPQWTPCPAGSWGNHRDHGEEVSRKDAVREGLTRKLQF